MNIGNIVASLQLNTSNFVNGLRQALQQMNSTFGSNSQSNINNTGNAVDNLAGHLKSVERIIGGIFISQLFYRMTNEVRQAAGSMADFMNSMEKAQIAMQYFLGDAEKAKGFIMNMEDFAAKTAFSTEQALTLSRRLMAAQFDPTKVRSIMEILNDASSATGGTAEQMDRIVLALTQMRTNGKIAGQELRQLAEAGIPVYKILAEELGISEDKLLNIGKMHISGDLGVAAILRGLEKRYKGAAVEIANTMSGLWETITDDAKMIGQGLFYYPYKAFESFVRGIRDKFEELRDIAFKSGIGGVFEHIFSPATQSYLRLILGSFNTLAKSVGTLVMALKPAIVLVSSWFTQAFGMALPILAGFTRAIANGITYLLQISPALNYFIGTVMTLLIANTVSSALLILWRITGMGMICTAVASAVTKLYEALQLVMILMVENPLMLLFIVLAGVLAYFALQVDSVRNSLTSLSSALASFAGFNANAIMVPSINNATKHIKGFNQSVNAGVGNLADVGKGLDAVADKAKKAKEAFTASFDEVYQIPNNNDSAAANPKTPSTGGLGGGLNVPDMPSESPAIVPEGSFHPGKSIWQTLWGNAKANSKMLWDGLVDITKGIAKWLKSIVILGLTWTVKITLAITSWCKKVKEKIFAWAIETSVKIINWTSDILDKIQGFSLKVIFHVVKWIEDTAKAIAGWAKDTGEDFKNWADNIKAAVEKWASDTADSISSWASDTASDIEDWASDTVTSIGNWATNAALSVGNWSTETGGKIASWVTDTAKNIGGWVEGRATDFKQWADDVKGSVESWAKNTGNSISTWVSTKATDFVNWASQTKASISTWVTDTAGNIGSWASHAGNSISSWVSTSISNIGKWSSQTWSSISSWVSNTTGNIGSWASHAGSSIGSWASGAINSVANWSSQTWNSISSWAWNTSGSIYDWAYRVGNGIVNGFASARNAVGSVFSNFYNHGIKPALNQCIDGLNWFIGVINSMHITLPKINVPGLPKFAGGIIGLPSMPYVPHLATGGIVLKDQLIRAGENNHKEAVVPLENPAYMKPFSDAVASQLLASGAFGGGGQQQGQQPIFYVGTLVADNRGLKELNRRMRIVTMSEGIRGVEV
jgi:tape measure domain-containing protein